MGQKVQDKIKRREQVKSQRVHNRFVLVGYSNLPAHARPRIALVQRRDRDSRFRVHHPLVFPDGTRGLGNTDPSVFLGDWRLILAGLHLAAPREVHPKKRAQTRPP